MQAGFPANYAPASAASARGQISLSTGHQWGNKNIQKSAAPGSNHANVEFNHGGVQKSKKVQEPQLNPITANMPIVVSHRNIVIPENEVNSCTSTARVVSDQFSAKDTIAGHDPKIFFRLQLKSYLCVILPSMAC